MNQQVKTQYPVTDRVRHAMQVSLRGCEELIPQDEWQQKLARSEATGVDRKSTRLNSSHT